MVFSFKLFPGGTLFGGKIPFIKVLPEIGTFKVKFIFNCTKIKSRKKELRIKWKNLTGFLEESMIAFKCGNFQINEKKFQIQ